MKVSKQKLFRNEWPYFKFDEVKLLSKYNRWRKVAGILDLSKAAKGRLEWIIYYYEKADANASLVSRHFGIARKTFYKWFNVFDEDNIYALYLLEDKSTAPNHVRQKEITAIEKMSGPLNVGKAGRINDLWDFFVNGEVTVNHRDSQPAKSTGSVIRADVLYHGRYPE